jgi:PIN domain nuclease of toxin-antitoxin system
LSFLIDTHVFIWFETGSNRLSRRARALLEDANETAYFSAASFWEIAVKRRAGKLAFKGSARAAAADAGLLELDINAADAEIAGDLDWDHRDPFDRMLIAQCLNRNLTLLSADPRLRARQDIGVIWAG